jgi:16S rRNA (guanine527-N7)-methyltransferase
MRPRTPRHVRPLDSELETLLESAGAQPGLAARLAEYGRLVLEMNRRFNLTGAKSAAELADHITDSLTVLPHLIEPYVDVGSGGGMPAIPIAIASGIAVTMIEATAKKARFLESTLERLGLRGTVVAQRAEIAGHRAGLREAFASGTCRALGSAPTVAELLLPLIRPGGIAILQRGTIFPAERRALEDASLMLGGHVAREEPLEGDRRLVLVEKRASTALRFPRRPGIPGKRPLCSD